MRGWKKLQHGGLARLGCNSSGGAEGGATLFKLNTEAPASANAEASLSGVFLSGKRILRWWQRKKCVELLPSDTANAEFKAEVGKHAQEKIARLKAEKK